MASPSADPAGRPRPRRVGTSEAVEDPLRSVRGDSEAFVGTLDDQVLRPVLPGSQLDRGALVYTLWLKRSTTQNIVIGGAAGAIPPLSGWAAAHGHVGLGALYLFAGWTWARRRGDGRYHRQCSD